MNNIKTFLILVIAFQYSSIHAACPRAGEFQAADLSTPVNQAYLTKMREIGVHTIIRYYDHTNETLRGKTLRLREKELIQRNGLNLAVVFQHKSNRITSFTADRGRRDADRSLHLTGVLSQPRGTAIYFGVDGGWSRAADLEKIKTYFQTAKPIINRAGFKMGAYGSGLACKMLLDHDLAEFCWLSNATSWPGFQDFYRSQRWSMRQTLPRTCAGFEADFNVVNPRHSDFGQFR
jgi:hypothetical protein